MTQVAKRLLLIGVSFLAGLFVFYIPEQSYRQLEEIWLPPSVASQKSSTLSLPVRSWSSGSAMRFGPELPGGPQISEANAKDAPSCKDMFKEEALQTQACKRLGSMRIAVTGMATDKDAEVYVGTFVKVARRDVSSVLGRNRRHAADIMTALRDQRDMQSLLDAQAYAHVPFDIVMPATLPANWTQRSIRISGTDAKHPMQVDIFYNKGRDRNIVVTLVPSAGFRLDTMCGPTPSLNGQFVSCSKVSGENYSVGGQSDGSVARWYAYRAMGNVMAIVQVSAFAQPGSPPVLLNRDLDVQAAIIRSLHVVDRTRLKGATFSGTRSAPYTDLGM